MKLIWKGILVFALCATSSLGIAEHSTHSKSDFNGEWRWLRGEEELTLYLKQTGKSLSGHHSAIGQGGMKVDEVADDQPPSITGEVQGGTATVEFKSGFPDSRGGGRAKLTLKGGFLYWRVLESTGEHYLPRSAKLARIHRRAESLKRLSQQTRADLAIRKTIRGKSIFVMAPPLAHANLLAKGWGAPNAYIKDADRLFRANARGARMGSP